MRTHIIVAEELIKEIDQLAGKRKRSRFVEEAIREKLEREVLGRALEKSAGILDLKKHPEWDTPEKISAWVRASRQLDNESLKDKLGDRA